MTDKGGKITHEFSLIKGFTYVAQVVFKCFTHSVNSAEFPNDSVQTLESNEHVVVEADSVVKTQKS